MQRIYDKEHNHHWIYLDDENTPLLIPSLYNRYTTYRNLTVEFKVERDRVAGKTVHSFKEIEIQDAAQYMRGNQLGLFLEWVDEQKKSSTSRISLAYHTALPQDVINEYVNDYLIDKMGKSEKVVRNAVAALKSYYNWLHYFLGNKYKTIGVHGPYLKLLKNNKKQGLLIKYILPATRELLYRKASSLLEEIVLRNGGELGCRTSENIGFLLNNFKANKKKHDGILTLFKELDTNPDKQEFEYHLSSLYTKYSRSRTLYISRELLEKMKLYYDTERPKGDGACNTHLFISGSTNDSRGKCISAGYGTDTFTKTARLVIHDFEENPALYSGYQSLSEGSVYHHLRHSFGTDIFYGEAKRLGKKIESITTESAVYIETARRLGHKVDGYYANQTTKTYIHSSGHRERLLEETVNE